jgi:hypothetical protein
MVAMTEPPALQDGKVRYRLSSPRAFNRWTCSWIGPPFVVEVCFASAAGDGESRSRSQSTPPLCRQNSKYGAHDLVINIAMSWAPSRRLALWLRGLRGY